MADRDEVLGARRRRRANELLERRARLRERWAERLEDAVPRVSAWLYQQADLDRRQVTYNLEQTTPEDWQ